MENNEEKTVNENTGVANAQDDDKLIHNIELSWPFMDCMRIILYGNKKSEYNAFHCEDKD
jgi:hypothetical protein